MFLNVNIVFFVKELWILTIVIHTSAQKVQNALHEMGIQCNVVELSDTTRTAMEAAQTIGCTVAQIVKSLIFKGKNTGNPILVLVSGKKR